MAKKKTEKKKTKKKAVKRSRPAGRGRKAVRTGEATASRILDAAYELFVRRRAFHESTIEDVAKRARVAKGTVYLYHRSKEDLLFASIERELDAVQLPVLEGLRTAADPAKQLRAFADLDRCFDPRIASLREALLVVSAHPAAGVRRRARALIRKALGRAHRAFTRLFAAAAGGRTWRGVRVEALAIAYVTALHELGIQAREGFIENPKNAHAAAAALAKLLVPEKGKS